VFTGFRDKALENTIQSLGGDVKTGVSKKVNYVVVGGVKGEGSAKEKKAMEYGIPILSLEELRVMFGL
jgi:NAD-dependent DNA ligase